MASRSTQQHIPYGTAGGRPPLNQRPNSARTSTTPQPTVPQRGPVNRGPGAATGQPQFNGGQSYTQPQPLQQTLGAPQTPPAGQQQGTGIYSQFANPVTFMNSLFGGGSGGDGGWNFNFNGGGNSSSQSQSPARSNSLNYNVPYSVSGNPVQAGSWHSPGSGPNQVAQIGAWQNAQATGPRLQQTLGSANQYNGGGDAADINARVWQNVGQGMIGTGNPVQAGSWHTPESGPNQVGAIGAWQNSQALNHLAQGMGYRGPQFATSDYTNGVLNGSPQYIGGSLAAQNQYLAGQGAGTTPAPQSAPPSGDMSGSKGGGSGASPNSGTTGGGNGIAPIYSTIDGQRTIYDDGQTQRNVNQQVEESRTKGSMRGNMKKFARPGMSMDAGTAAAAAPEVGSNYADALAAQASGGLTDQLLNSNYQLQGQEAQGNETLALADLIRRLQATQNNTNNAMQGMVLNPLGDMIGNLLSSI